MSGAERRGRIGWTLLGVLAIATVLRPSVVVIGPVLPPLQDDLGLGSTAAALLTTLPVLCFGLGAFAGPWLVRRLGVDAGISVAVVLLVAGTFVRVLGGSALLFVGTAVAGGAIAIGNVLLPALVRRDFADRIGPVTGLYTSTLAMSSGLAALTAVPLAGLWSAGWRIPLGFWCLLAAAALFAWAPHQWRHRTRAVVTSTLPTHHSGLRLLRHPTARSLTAYMGLQSIGFYAMVTWLPSILQDGGTDPRTAGALLSLAAVLGIPASLLVPIIATRMRDQRAVAIGTSVLPLVAWAGLLLAPNVDPLIWVVPLGIGTGATFPIALLLISLRSKDPTVTPQLSSIVQGVGYLLAAAGPFMVGVLHGVTGDWQAALLLLVGLNVLQLAAAWSAGRSSPI